MVAEDEDVIMTTTSTPAPTPAPASASAPTPTIPALDSQTEAKLLKAQQLKEEGNAAFRDGDLKTAATKYHEIYFYVSGLDKGVASLMGIDESTGLKKPEKRQKKQEEGEEEEMETSQEQEEEREDKADDLQHRVKEFLFIHHINLAAVLLKQEKYQRCVESCTKALEIKPNNPKGLFRRGKAYLLLWPKKDKLDQAKADIQACVQADPNNREARSLLVDLKDKYRQMAEEQKRELSGFLSRQR